MRSTRSRWSRTDRCGRASGSSVISEDSTVSQIIRLDAGARYVDFDTEVDWHETNRLLTVAFPVDVRSLRATYEIQFGHVERPTHANTSWDVARFEVCAHRWADLSEPGYGVALLNDSKYGYDIAGNVIRLSLLRSPTWPDPVADRGTHRFVYRLFPHAGDLREAGVIEGGYDLNVPLIAHPTTPVPEGRRHRLSLLSVDAPHVVIDTVKTAEDGSDALVVRLYEAWGRRGPATVQAPVGHRPGRTVRSSRAGEDRDLGRRLGGDRRRLPFRDRHPQARAVGRRSEGNSRSQPLAALPTS